MICSICNRKYNKEQFLPFGPSKRPFVACPTRGCFSSERDRFTALFIEKNRVKYDKTLHIAPETNIQKILKKYSNNYICGDLYPEQYKHLHCIYLDATKLSFPDNTFQLVYASHILEHIPDDIKAMEEIYRVLTKKGVLIALIPQDLEKDTYEDNSIIEPEERKKHFGQSDHVRMYGIDFTQRLKKCGFYVQIYCHESISTTVDKMEHDNKFVLGDIYNNYNLNKNEILYICYKL
jgi:SAM-dependent methyltransferase